MLFMIMAKHSPESCPMINTVSREKLISSNQRSGEVAKALGVNILGTWADMPAHLIFMLVDAPKPEALSKMAVELHLVDWNTSVTHPVVTMQDAMAQLQQLKK
jgi:Domain of unknown function (DUF3303)